MRLLVDSHVALWWLGRHPSLGGRCHEQLVVADPFDRMLVAQAQLESLVLVTADQALRPYDVELVDARS